MMFRTLNLTKLFKNSVDNKVEIHQLIYVQKNFFRLLYLTMNFLVIIVFTSLQDSQLVVKLRNLCVVVSWFL